jgi:RHS repeat-associated protein
MTMNRLIQARLFAIVVAVAAFTSLLIGAETPREGTYVVTLEASAAVDGVQILGAQLAATYGGTLATEAGAPQDAFVLHISAERARVLAKDPRVTSVRSSILHPTIQNAAEVVNWSGGVSYTYDGSGNISQIGTDKFLYDDAGRLVQATTNSVQRNFEYDAFGNRKKCLQSDGDCQVGFTINTSENKNRIDQATYDASGNVKTLPSLRHAYSYDAFNMMTRDDYAPMAREFVYTADDERIAVYNVGTSWRWTLRDTSGKVLREFTSGDGAGATWQWAKDFVWRDNLLLASRQAVPGATTTYHYHLDHLGTPRRITDQDDRIIGVHDYHPFGQEVPGGTSEPLSAALKYTGHERDIWLEGSPDTLDYMHARYYSPVLGRFLSADPALTIDRNTSQPQGWNRYSYAVNNPVKLVDRDGKDWTLFIRDSSGGGITNFGHTALRVFGPGYDFTYDYGRYGDTKMLLWGDGILRVWNNWSEFLIGQASHGKGTMLTWQTSASMDQAMIAHFNALTKAGKQTNSSSKFAPYFTQYKLAGEFETYNLFGTNCSTISVDAMKQVSDEMHVQLQLLDLLNSISPEGLTDDLNMSPAERWDYMNQNGIIPREGPVIPVTVNGSPIK